MMNEAEVLEMLKKHISALKSKKAKPLRVAINGIEGAGKTIFAEKLTRYLVAQGFAAIHVSIDGFHNNREIRYRQGKDSAKGYYEDSYDELAFTEKVLISSQSENPQYISAIHDLETDEYLDLSPISISNDTILITDGAYLFKPVYREHWDLKIYLETDFFTAMFRGMNRDFKHLGGLRAAKEKYENRYHKSSRMYILENDPKALADIIIDNTDFEKPKVVKNSLAEKI